MSIDTFPNGLRLVTVSGSAAEMGGEVGRILRSEIEFLYDARLMILKQSSGLPEVTIAAVCQRLWRAIQINLPTIAAEVEATASSSGLAPWQLVIAGGYSDVLDVLGVNSVEVAECTLGLRTGAASLFGTWDSHPEAQQSMVVLRRLASDQVATLSLTTAGWPCQFGLNSSGLGFGITNLTPMAASADGVVYIAAIADAAAQADTAEAIASVARLPLASGHSYVLFDQASAQVVETTASRISLKEAGDFLIETNHYTTLIDDNSNYRFLGGSIDRAAEMAKVLATISTPQQFVEWLSSSQRVWRHDPSAPAVTCAVYAVVPSAGGMWIAPGEQPRALQFVSLSDGNLTFDPVP